MKNLIKLSPGIGVSTQREICLSELIKVKPHKFKKQINLYGKNLYWIEVEILEVNQKGDLLRVVAKAWKDGVEIKVDNPLYYHNAPIMIPDGTFETKIDEFGKEMQMPNFVENPEEALRQIVLETIRVTSLKE